MKMLKKNMCLGLCLQELIIICLFVEVASIPQQSCAISGVCECDYDTDTSLHIVNCSLKELSSIPNDLPTDREYYTFTGNSIYSLEDDAFNHIVNALVLDMGANWLTKIPVNIFAPFRNLRHLGLQYNELVELSEDVFDPLQGLQQLDLKLNKLVSLPAGIFKSLGNLQTLLLQGNMFFSFEVGTFDGLNNLQHLYLQDNVLVTLEAGIFYHLFDLETLDISSNLLTSIPVKLFQKLYFLAHLMVHNNLLTTLDVGVFEYTHLLKTFTAHENQLTELPDGIFNNMGYVKILQLHRNELAFLQVDIFKRLHSIQYLFLHQNKLSNFPVGIFDSNNKLLYINITNNLLQCDCTLLDLYLLIKALTNKNILVNADCTVFGRTDKITISNLTEDFFKSCTATTVDVAEPIPGLTETVPVSFNNDESTTQLTQTILDSKYFPKEHATQEPTSTALRLTQEPTSIAINSNFEQTEQKSVLRMTHPTNTDHRVNPFEETTIRNVQQQQLVNNVKTSGIPFTPITAVTVVGVSAIGVVAYFGVAKLASKLRWSSAVTPNDQRDSNVTRPRIPKDNEYALAFRPSEDDEKRRRRQLEEMIDLKHV